MLRLVCPLCVTLGFKGRRLVESWYFSGVRSVPYNLFFSKVKDSQLRAVLTADYAELQIAVGNRLNKAILVLAGGIVEAVLIDYLLAIGYQRPPKGTDPRSMLFGDLITACEEEGALTRETAALCGLLKEYRNLIHPGRSARMQELADSSRAEIAEKLVDRVVRDVATRASRRPEWAAEMVLEFTRNLGRYEDDPAVDRKVRALSEDEVVRLIVDLLPDRFKDEIGEIWGDEDEDWDEFIWPFRACFESALKLAPTPAWAAAGRRLLRELDESGDLAEAWLATFFQADLLAALDAREREDMFAYLEQEPVTPVGVPWVIRWRGLAAYLSSSQAPQLVEALFGPPLAAGSGDVPMRSEYVAAQLSELSPESSTAAQAALDGMVQHQLSVGNGELASQLSEYRYKIWPLLDEEIPR